MASQQTHNKQSGSSPAILTLRPEDEDAYIHLNVLMLEHLQQRDLEAAYADAHRILSLYVGQEVTPLPTLPAPSSSSSAPSQAKHDEKEAETALVALKARLQLIQQLPHTVPAREVLFLAVQRSAAGASGLSSARKVGLVAEDDAADGVDSTSDDDASSRSEDAEEDDEASTSSSSSSSSSSSATGRATPLLAREQGEVDVNKALALAVARLEARGPATASSSQPPTTATTITTSTDKTSTHAPSAPCRDAPVAAGSDVEDAELLAQEAAWMADAEDDIEKEMQRLAVVRMHR